MSRTKSNPVVGTIRVLKKANDAIAARVAGLHRDEEGMMVWAVLVAILFFLVMTAFVFNASKTVVMKIETQNAADSMAYSGSVWSARGMNTITATNHLIGELNALYVLHHALGGRHLDQRDTHNNDTAEWRIANIALAAATVNLLDVFQEVTGGVADAPVIKIPFIDREISLSIGLADLPGIGMAGYDTVKGPTFADRNSALFEAKLTLKVVMTALYIEHTAKLVELVAAIAVPIFGWAKVPGIVSELRDLRRQEEEIARQYDRLSTLETLARTLKPAKLQIPGAISALHSIQRFAIEPVVPVTINACVDQLADMHQTNGYLVGDSLVPLAPLPIERELAFGELPDEERSQLIRATYPWVTHWRKPVWPLIFAMAPKSMVGIYYVNWTERYTLQSSEWMRSKEIYKDELTVINSPESRHPHWTEGIDNVLSKIRMFADDVLGNPSNEPGVKGLDVRLYVVKGVNEVQGRKGKEAWNDRSDPITASKKIDDLFCQCAFAQSKQPPALAAGAFFRQENPSGIVCVSQSMIYNANMLSDLSGSEQPRVTWDTLAWTSKVAEYESGWIGSAAFDALTDLLDGAPKITLNWQAKLTPITSRKLTRASVTVGVVNNDLGNVLLKTSPAISLINH